MKHKKCHSSKNGRDKGGENGKDGFGLGLGACGEVHQQKVGLSKNLRNPA
jgi:hypothetical protein